MHKFFCNFKRKGKREKVISNFLNCFYKRKNNNIRCTHNLAPFVIKNWGFIVNERNLIFYSKYCPSYCILQCMSSTVHTVYAQLFSVYTEQLSAYTEILSVTFKFQCILWS